MLFILAVWLSVTPHWGMCVPQEAEEGHNTAAEPLSVNVKLVWMLLLCSPPDMDTKRSVVPMMICQLHK